MVEKLHGWYEPVLSWAIKHDRELIVGAVCAFVISLAAFSKLGGEFIPSLEEGDFAAELSMSQGTSLSQMTEATTMGEKLLKTKYPEIKQIVTRIGSAEIPTDPMPVERADMMIALKPKAEWTSAKTKDELMESMSKTLETIPGLEVEMSQPIQMRNNELITGIRQDVAINIYGEDLDVLAEEASKVAEIVKKVDGVTNPYVEKVQGLPQIQVVYNHERMAEYGISIKDANNILKTAFAGNAAGAVYEGEKKFDIVLRLDKDLRNDISSLENLYLPVSGGGAIPLSQVAKVEYVEAPSQITHDEGTRRIYVGFNVRGRDIESTVEEIEQLVCKKISLPAGYYYTYGVPKPARCSQSPFHCHSCGSLSYSFAALRHGEKHSRNAFCVQCHTACGYRRNLGVVVAGHALFHIGGSGFHSSFRRCGAQRNCSRGSA